MKIDLQGKVAMVTASSRGIGLGIARGLALAGARVSLCARNTEELDNSIRGLSAETKTPVFGMAGDLSDRKFLDRFVKATMETYGSPVQILVFNTGGPPVGEILSVEEEIWDAAFEAQLLSLVRLTRLVCPGMVERKWGRVVALTSTNAVEPTSGMGVSSTFRAATLAFVKTLSRELGPHGVTANSVLTGACLTDRLKSLVRRGIGPDGDLEAELESIAKSIPVGHVSTTDEFARSIVFLCSAEASYVSGAALPVDGGMMCSL